MNINDRVKEEIDKYGSFDKEAWNHDAETEKGKWRDYKDWLRGGKKPNKDYRPTRVSMDIEPFSKNGRRKRQFRGEEHELRIIVRGQRDMTLRYTNHGTGEVEQEKLDTSDLGNSINEAAKKIYLRLRVSPLRRLFG